MKLHQLEAYSTLNIIRQKLNYLREIMQFSDNFFLTGDTF